MTISDYAAKKKHYKKSDSVLLKSLAQQGFEKYFSLASEPASLNIRQMMNSDMYIQLKKSFY